MENSDGYQYSIDFSQTNNVNGIETEFTTFTGSGSNGWNIGKYTDLKENEVGAQIYMPDKIDETTQIVVYYKGMDESYASRNCITINDYNYDNNTILIFPDGCYYSSGEEAANTLNSLSKIIPGDWNNVTVAGVSAGGGSAFALARNYSIKEDGTYNYHISTLSLGDSYHPEKQDYYIPHSDDDYLAMINKDIKLIGVTSSGNPYAVKVFEHWAKLDGDVLYIDYQVNHDSKCTTPYRCNYLNWILNKGSLDNSFINQLNHFYTYVKDPETGELVKKDITYEEANQFVEKLLNIPLYTQEELTEFYNKYSDDNKLYDLKISKLLGKILGWKSEFLSSDAGFLYDNIETIISKINNTRIKNLNVNTNYLSTTVSPKIQDVRIMEYINNVDQIIYEVLRAIDAAMNTQEGIGTKDNDLKNEASDLPGGNVRDSLVGTYSGLASAADLLGYTGSKKQEFIDKYMQAFYEESFHEEAENVADIYGLSGEERSEYIENYINDKAEEFKENMLNYNYDVETIITKNGSNGSTNYHYNTQNNSSNSQEYSDIISNENTDVFKSKDSNYKIIVHHDNDKVTSVEHYYEFGSTDKAFSSVRKIAEEYSGNDVKVNCSGQYVKVTFDDSYFNSSSYSEFISQYEGYVKVTK